MSQEQLERYFKDTIELIIDKSKDFYEENKISDEEYKTNIGGILKTFINKFYSYQSQLLFSNINEVKIDYKKDDIKLDIKDFDINQCFNSNLNIENIEKEDGCSSPPLDYSSSSSTPTSPTPSSPRTSSPTPTFDINYFLQKHNLTDNSIIDYSNFSENGEINNDKHYYSSDPEFETQCCARISNEWFKIDEYSSEFLDKYPAGVFITTDGYVVGKPCHNMIPDEEFDEGNIFCDKHCSSNYEDIREAPRILDTDT